MQMLQDPQTAFAVVVLGLLCAAILYVALRSPAASLQFGKMLGQQLKAGGLQYTHHYTEKFMGSRQRQLLDAETGVYRYDQLIVLKDTHMPAALLEAGSIINRDEELAMETPARQGPLTMELALGSVWNTAASVGSLTQAPTTRENPCSATNNYAQKSRWQNVVPMVDFVRLIWRNETTCLFPSPTYPGTFST
jgi:hypothetical protein